MSTFKLEFAESELKITLEALVELESKYSRICEDSEDDEVANYGNDLIEVRLLLQRVKEKAVAQFGPHIIDFSRELL